MGQPARNAKEALAEHGVVFPSNRAHLLHEPHAATISPGIATESFPLTDFCGYSANSGFSPRQTLK